MLPIPTCDLRPDLVATAAVDKLLETEPHRLGTTRNDSSRYEVIDRSRQVVRYPRHQLRHAASIDNCNAQCDAALT